MSFIADHSLPGAPGAALRARGTGLSEAALADLERRIRAGAVVWDLRPIHEVQRAPIKGAVSLGQVDWVLDDRETGRLQPPSVIGKILARAGIFAGTQVILYAGRRVDAIALAKLALQSIGVDRIAVLRDDQDLMRAGATLGRPAAGLSASLGQTPGG